MPDADDQDSAEAYDEEISLGDDRDSVDLDIAPDVYDSTHARGDEDVDGDDEALDADEEDDALLGTLGDTGEDEDDLDDDDDVDALDEDDLSGDDLAADADEDDETDDVDGVASPKPDEVDLTDMEDIETIGGSVGRTSDFESETLSDADLEELDYTNPTTGAARAASEDVESGQGGASTPDHVDDDDAAGDLTPESLDPSHHDHPDRQSERLDEGLEETFPGSDPVAVKHIT